MNLTTLTQVAATFAQDPQQTRYSGLFTQALNLAQQQFALDSKALWKDWPATTITSGTANYSLPSDFMFEKLVALNGLKLKPISRLELELIKDGDRWDDDTGTPTHYIIDPEEARKQILLYPIPTSNDTGKDLVVTYHPLPADMANGGDTPLNSYALLAQFHIGLAAWAAWYLLQGEPASAALMAKKKELLQIYNDSVSLAMDTFKNTFGETMRMRGNRSYY